MIFWLHFGSVRIFKTQMSTLFRYQLVYEIFDAISPLKSIYLIFTIYWLYSIIPILFFRQFDQSQLMLASAEYYQLGLSHPIMQTYYNILVNVATMMGAGSHTAKRDMKDLLEFEIQLAEVCIDKKYSWYVFSCII